MEKDKKPWLFKKGNKEWERRSKHGRDKIFASAKMMLDSFYEYVQWNSDNPLPDVKPMVVDKMVEQVTTNKMRALTWKGFCIFIGCNSHYFNDFRSDKEKCTKDFSEVIKTIDEIIYTQKFEGAAAGFLHANIISRDLGLADKMINDNINQNYNTDITPEEAKAIRAGIEKDI